MNIGIGKIGKSVLFKRNKWGLIGGDESPAILFSALANMNKEHNFILIGRSDFNSLTKEEEAYVNKNKNLFDYIGDRKGIDLTEKSPVEYLNKKNIKLDVILLINGPSGHVNVPGVCYKLDGSKIGLPSQMFKNYTGQIVYTANYFKDIPIIVIAEDPRYIPWRARDLYNRPKVYLSQYSEIYEPKHIVRYNDKKLITTKENGVYAGVEKIFLMGEEKVNILKYKKDILFNLILNGVTNSGATNRYPIVKDYVLDNGIKSNVYGKWNEEVYKDRRFKCIKMANILDEVKRTKYTLIIPIKENWVTSKFWKMLCFGIIPFLHPLYDTQHHINCPDFLRVDSSFDLKKKIIYLEKYPDKYKKLMKKLNNMLKESYYDGRFINNMIMKVINKVLKKEWKISNKKNTIKLSEFN